MRRRTKAGLAAALLIGGVLAAHAAGFLTNGLPVAGGAQYPTTLPLTGNEQAPFDTMLTQGQNPASEAITTNMLASFGASQPDNTNFLIAGDASQNLFQRGTTSASLTTSLGYGPDRWFYWGGTSTNVELNQDTSSSDFPNNYSAGYQLTRNTGSGVKQICMAQVIESVNSYALAGQTVELDFHAFPLANFSAANVAMNAYIIAGTGTDEGATKMAFGLNGQVGSTAWANQTNVAAAVVNMGAVSTQGRFTVVANVPATIATSAVTEVGVALCYTPVGTAGTHDAVTFAGIQLKRSPSLAGYASASVGYNSTTIPASSFQRRPLTVEQLLQYRYYWRVIESGTSGVIQATGVTPAASTTTCQIVVKAPVPMFPTGVTNGGITTNASATTFKMIANSTPAAVVLATPFITLPTGGAGLDNQTFTFLLTGGTSSATALYGCSLESVGSTGYFGITAEE